MPCMVWGRDNDSLRSPLHVMFLHPAASEEVGSDHVYINKHMMSRIVNSIPLRIRKVCRGLWYLAYRTFCSSATFEGTGGDAASKILACKYGAVLQKIGLECI